MSYEAFAKALQRAEIGITNADCVKAGEIILELETRRAELLEALKISEKKIVDSYDAITKGHAEAFLSRDPQLSVIRNAIANAEK